MHLLFSKSTADCGPLLLSSLVKSPQVSQISLDGFVESNAAIPVILLARTSERRFGDAQTMCDELSTVLRTEPDLPSCKFDGQLSIVKSLQWVRCSFVLMPLTNLLLVIAAHPRFHHLHALGCLFLHAPNMRHAHDRASHVIRGFILRQTD